MLTSVLPVWFLENVKNFFLCYNFIKLNYRNRCVFLANVNTFVLM